VKYGLAHGINIGDYMLVKVFRAMMEHSPHPIPPCTRDKIFEVLTSAFDHTHIGQALDINARSRHDLTTEEYFLIVSEKTGYCLAAPMIAAAILTGAGKSVRRAFESYAKAIGPMFQIRDDMLDLTEGKGRKSIGSDIREGKRSFLVAHVGGICAGEEREKLYLILDTPREKTTDEDIQWVSQLFQKYGSFKAAEEINKHLLSEAFRAIARIPQNLKELLISFAELLLTRNR
jgi:geranylgeranyl pyrophosphate synthase